MTDNILYKKAVERHTALAVQLYSKDKLLEISRRAGFSINDDGSCSASTEADIKKYVNAVREVCGPLAGMSAETQIMAFLIIYSTSRKKE